MIRPCVPSLVAVSLDIRYLDQAARAMSAIVERESLLASLFLCPV